MDEVVSIGEVFDKLRNCKLPERAVFQDLLTVRWTVKKLHRNSARFWTNSWSRPALFAYVSFKLIDRGMIFETVVRTSVNICTSFSSYEYCGPSCKPPISVRHFKAIFRNSGASKNLLRRVSMIGVSKMNPRGIQLRKRRRVSRVALIKLV